jgi:hypothetical protein
MIVFHNQQNQVGVWSVAKEDEMASEFDEFGGMFEGEPRLLCSQAISGSVHDLRVSSIDNWGNSLGTHSSS